MDFKPLGGTDFDVPVVGLGTSNYRGGIDSLRRGMALGAWHIDTAENYGTEGVVGEAVRGRREQVFLATKVQGGHLKRHDLLRAADQSLRRLDTDLIDLYQVHWPNSRVPIAETMGAMEELVDQGKVRFIGVSNFSVRELQDAQRAMTRHRIVSNQVLYNLADRKIEADLLPYCQQQQVTIIAYCPLGRGKLVSRPLLSRRRGLETLEKVATETGKTVAQVALNWCVSKPGVVAIPKANRVEHVIENCTATGWSLTPDQMETVETAFR